MGGRRGALDLPPARPAGDARRGDARTADVGGAGKAVVAAYTVNELDEAARDALLARLVRGADRR